MVSRPYENNKQEPKQRHYLVGHNTIATERFSHESVWKPRAEATRFSKADQAPPFRPCLLSRTDGYLEHYLSYLKEGSPSAY
jgi:hypothetical protein